MPSLTHEEKNNAAETKGCVFQAAQPRRYQPYSLPGDSRNHSPQRVYQKQVKHKFPARVDFPYHYPYPRTIKEQRRGGKMTACIAISCDCNQPKVPPKFVLVTDGMVSTVLSSTQEAFKVRQLCNGWYTAYSGDNTGWVDEITRLVYGILEPQIQPTIGNVEYAMAEAYQHVRRKLITDQFLSTYEWKLAEFLQKGRQKLGDSGFAQLRSEIDRVDLGCEFLVCGFDTQQKEEPILFHVMNPGVVTPYDNASGYAAIGSGGPSATAYLDWRRQKSTTPVGESLYNGIAAKCFAEAAGALGVGPKTDVVIVEQHADNPRRLSDAEVKSIEEIYQREEAGIRPANIDERIYTILNR